MRKKYILYAVAVFNCAVYFGYGFFVAWVWKDTSSLPLALLAAAYSLDKIADSISKIIKSIHDGVYDD